MPRNACYAGYGYVTPRDLLWHICRGSHAVPKFQAVRLINPWSSMINVINPWRLCPAVHSSLARSGKLNVMQATMGSRISGGTGWCWLWSCFSGSLSLAVPAPSPVSWRGGNACENPRSPRRWKLQRDGKGEPIRRVGVHVRAYGCVCETHSWSKRFIDSMIVDRRFTTGMGCLVGWLIGELIGCINVWCVLVEWLACKCFYYYYYYIIYYYYILYNSSDWLNDWWLADGFSDCLIDWMKAWLIDIFWLVGFTAAQLRLDKNTSFLSTIAFRRTAKARNTRRKPHHAPHHACTVFNSGPCSNTHKTKTQKPSKTCFGMSWRNSWNAISRNSWPTTTIYDLLMK